MNDAYVQGQHHFARGNYYGARDAWREMESRHAGDLDETVILNALGAVHTVLSGPSAARGYFERVVDIGRRTEIPAPQRMKYIANLAVTLSALGNVETAVALCTEAGALVSAAYPNESFYVLNSWMFTLGCGELHKDMLDLSGIFENVVENLPVELRNSSQVAVFYQNLGHATETLGQLDESRAYFMRALDIYPTSGTLQAMARSHLLEGNIDNAVEYVEQLYDALWHSSVETEKVELADTLVLLGQFSYFAGKPALCERYFEKAELYYGQTFRWGEWLRMRTLVERLRAYPVHVPVDVMDWQLWETFLDDLSLMDGLDAMFPALFRSAQLATALAERLARRLGIDLDGRHSRTLKVAGRLVYIGLTAMVEDEAGARQVLRSTSQRAEMVNLGVRLLSAYPHTQAYTEIISGHSKNSRQHKLAQCLHISLDYVEAIEIHGKSHEQAVAFILASGETQYGADVTAAFAVQSRLSD